jgi:endonuclease/exonuclease/phosphatase family metal-dependent hydrolase
MHRSALRVAAAIAVLCALASASLAGELRLMDYNILNYPGSTGTARGVHFRTIVADIAPDIVVVQEMLGPTGVTKFLTEVLNTVEPGLWASAPFHESYDSDRALFIRDECVTVTDNGWLDTDLRDIEWWDLEIAASGESFRLYTMHLKASSGGTNETRRYEECLILRAHLDAIPAGSAFLVAGDYNIYKSSEPAWGLLRSAGPGQLFDPIQTEGYWHNNASYAAVHTQSPRTTQFGGGANGGMDDRFDFILADDNMLDGLGLDLLPDTYTSFGNDGNHFNTSIIDGPNGVVTAEVANALHEASDHLPLHVNLTYSDGLAAGTPGAPLRLDAWPNPFNPATRLKFVLAEAGSATVRVYNTRGQRVAELLDARLEAGELSLDWRPSDLPGGLYLAELRVDGESVARTKLVLLK